MCVEGGMSYSWGVRSWWTHTEDGVLMVEGASLVRTALKWIDRELMLLNG